MKIFYNPLNLKIMGMSDGENSMDFPFIEVETKYHSTMGLEIILNKEKKPTLKINGLWEKGKPKQMIEKRKLKSK